MDFQSNKCPKCGKYNIILPSNNPLMPSICNHCIVSALQHDNLEHGDFFCRSYNIPFKPDLWMKLSNIHKTEAFKEYISEIFELYKDQIYQSATTDLWKKANKEWELIQTHEELMQKITPIMEGYVARNKIKWGIDYTFQELVTLENLFVNTLKAHDISNPMQIDAIKKACKISIALDSAIIERDSKQMNELSKTYQNFIKTAKIDDIITAASKDVISNVAELVDFIEKNGYQFKYYDNVSRDIVDKSLADIKSYIRQFVSSTTGLEIQFEAINNALKTEKALHADSESAKIAPLEDLYLTMQKKKEELYQEIDEELDSEEMQDFEEEDSDDRFG